MTPIVWFTIIWLCAVFITSLILIDKRKYITITVLMAFMFCLTMYQRLEYFKPYVGIPVDEFTYNHHKLVRNADEDQWDVILWATMVDNDNEMLYLFPLPGNEELY